MALSSASLFHFTPKLEFLKGILSEGFRYSFTTEEIPFGGYMESPATVMSAVKAVCFCDIPLSLSGEHRSQSRPYAVAMDREWGMTVGVTPIRYIHRRSPDLRNYTVKKFIELEGALRAPGSDIFTFYMRSCRRSASSRRRPRRIFARCLSRYSSCSTLSARTTRRCSAGRSG